MTGPTLAFVLQRVEYGIEQNNRLSDDMAVLLAMFQRVDGTVSGLVAEMRAVHRQQDRQRRGMMSLAADVDRLEQEREQRP